MAQRSEVEEVADSFCGKTLLYWAVTDLAAMFSFEEGKTIYLKIEDGKIVAEVEQAN